MNLFETAKSELLKSETEATHPFRFFYLSTHGEYPEIRTIVKRKAEADFNLLFFTDSRSPKVGQIKTAPNVTALFYHPEKLLQVRIRGKATLVSPQEEEFEQLLNQAKQAPNAKDYMSAAAPGALLNEVLPDEQSSEFHFAAVRILAEEVDVLQIGRERHLRCLYRLQNGDWEELELVP